MSYLSVTNFWKYQDRNAWKKAKTHPPWFKQYVHRDRELDKLPLTARLLFHELLATATRYSNVLEADLKWISTETRIEPETVADNLPLLLKGGWIKKTKSARRNRKPVPEPAPDPVVQDVDVDVDEEKALRPAAHAAKPDPRSNAGAYRKHNLEDRSDVELFERQIGATP